MVTAPETTKTPCSKAGSRVSVTAPPASSWRSAPQIGVCTSAGDRTPCSSPSSTVPRTPSCGSREQIRQLGVRSEARRHVADPVGQGYPQLHAVQPRRAVRPGDLAVHDAPPGGHQVELTRADQRLRSQAVAMLDRALQQPADGLQAGVRVGPDLHPRPLSQLLRPVVVQEAPGPDHPHLAVGQGPHHLGGLAQRHPPGGDQQLLGTAPPRSGSTTCSRGRVSRSLTLVAKPLPQLRLVSLGRRSTQLRAEQSAIESAYGRDHAGDQQVPDAVGQDAGQHRQAAGRGDQGR